MLWLYAYTLTAMKELGDIVASVRREAGLSLRELARLSGVSFTTINRIESGSVDPSFGMVQRILAATGRSLQIVDEPSKPPPPSIANLSDAVATSGSGERPDWTRLRAFLDYLARYPDQVAAAITVQPHTNSRLMRALLAGIAEKLADDHGIARPGWTWTAPRLRPEWSMPGTPRMQAAERAHTPSQLLDRGVIVGESTLWRKRVSVDA
jgi:transcriptional regulator with XRE-family HTH domain